MTMDQTASEQAGRARDLWEEAVRLERTADPDHGEWYGIAGEITGTVRALQSMASLLGERVAKYDQAPGRVVRDDEGLDPSVRLDEAHALLVELEAVLVSAEATAGAAWSSIGHIGVEHQ